MAIEANFKNKQIDDNGEALPTGENIQLQAGGSVSATPCPGMDNMMPPVEHLPPEPEPEPEPETGPEPEQEPEMNRLDYPLRLTALFLMLLTSGSIISRVGRPNPVAGDDRDLLAYGVFLFGVSLMFMSVMVAKSPLAAAFGALVVEFFHKFIFGDA